MDTRDEILEEMLRRREQETLDNHLIAKGGDIRKDLTF